MGHPVRPRLSFRESIPLFPALEDGPMIGLTDAQWLCICPFLYACPGIYVGNETRYRLFVAALYWMARLSTSWRRLPSVWEVEIGLSPLPRVRSGRLAAPDSLSTGRSGTVRGAAGQHRARVRERDRRAQKD